MDISTCLIIIGSVYCILYFFDTFFKTCAHYPYIQFLKGTGLQIKFLQLHWKTTAFNRTFVRWGSGYTKFLNIWFSVGLYVTLVLLPVAVMLLIIAVYQCFFNSSSSSGNSIMEPLIPGVNLPASELGYYSFTLVICGIIHEFGHALASVKEDVHVINAGIKVFLILPIAYVNLNSDDLQRINAWKSLKIFCAGVWHNLVLSLIAYFIYLIIPFVFSIIFYVNSGVSVTDISKHSPLLGHNGLFVGDKINQINNCKVSDESTWIDCLHKTRFAKPAFCISGDLVHSLDESVPLKHSPNGEFDCCDPNKISNVCFEYVDSKDGIIEIPPHVCLPVRSIIEKSTQYCDDNSYKCNDNLHCIRPLLKNNTNIITINCAGKSVIYLGYAGDILQTVQISSYIPKYFFVNTNFPDTIEKFLKYVIICSLGLAIVNVIPLLAMDGYYITNSIIDVVFVQHKTNKNILILSSLISLCGTSLFLSLIIHTLWISLK